LTFGWTYARSDGHTLLSIVRTYGGNHRTYREDHRIYALQTVQADICETIRHTLLFEYPLINTWTYEAAMESLGKNHQTYAPWLDIRCFSKPINTILPIFILHKFQTPPGCQSILRVFSKCFKCVL
jgi:hypothetical protein